MILRILISMMVAAMCWSCSSKSDPDIQDTFFGNVHLNQPKQQVLDALYQQQFVDAASHQADSRFDTIPLDNGDYCELKILSPTDTTGFNFLGYRWANLQIEFDGNGLYCITFRSRSATKDAINRQFAAILHTLSQSYAMQRMVIGHSDAEGAADIVGYRYESHRRMVQLYINENRDASAIVLSYIANKEE